MTCHEMRERIFEADLVELQGKNDTPLAVHLANCPDCRRLARKVVDGEAALGAALDALAPRPRGRMRRTRPGHWAALVPLAAAAVFAAIVLRGNLGNDIAPPVLAVTPIAVATPIVEPTRDENVAVFTTNDPDIVVVWFLGGTD